jgi:transposase-like protein
VLELIEKIDELKNNISAVGRYYGVTDNAVRKWCSLYKI